MADFVSDRLALEHAPEDDAVTAQQRPGDVLDDFADRPYRTAPRQGPASGIGHAEDRPLIAEVLD